ncbi:hypothetical protein B0H10DRAFT_1964241 [Mycena sp. CBHHK59/15]|nr:hypothetical protein B0H10DRAFT_1964241 [Mycena sp. CBHHK59/15]
MGRQYSSRPTTPIIGLNFGIGSSPSRACCSEILPPFKKVAPNQHSWPETEAMYPVIGAPRKGAKKWKNTDPYCGGESSGKLALPDARVAKKAKTSGSPHTTTSSLPCASQMEASIDSSAIETEEFDLSPPSERVTSAATSDLSQESTQSESPEMLLRTALALYNNVFPIESPQPTSYYRENTYVLPTTATRGSYYRCQ